MAHICRGFQIIRTEFPQTTRNVLWPWPLPDDLHIRTWPVFSPDVPDEQKWPSYVKAFESYRFTDRLTDTTRTMTHAASQVVIK